MKWLTHASEETEALGARFARTRPPPDSTSVIYLKGDLGAGKTTLARGFVHACGIWGAVRSPSYTLLEIYDAPSLSILHLDLYRVHDPTDLATLGLRDWARPGVQWLVEWPERGAGRLPDPDLTFALAAEAAGHSINVIAGSPLGEAWLQRVTPPFP